MSTRRWSELSVEHEVRYTGEVRFLVITMSKKSGVARGLYGLVVEVSGPNITSRRHNHAGVSREFQCTCSALRLPASKTGITLPKQADRSVLISGWEGEG